MSTNIMFGRKWKIELNTYFKLGGQLGSPLETHTLRNLRTTFSITNTLLGDPSLANFQIYNIGEKTERMLSSNTCYITLYCGYHSNDEKTWDILFSGEITNSYEIRQGVDSLWNVWARDAFTLLSKTNPTKASIATPIAPIKILEMLCADAKELTGLPYYVGDVKAKLEALPDEPDWTPTGTFKQEFDDLLVSNGIGWSVQSSELVIFNQEFTDPNTEDNEPTLINNKTGLLTIPKVDYKGVSLTTLLNGKLRPGRLIQVDPNTVTYDLGNEFYVKKFDKNRWNAKGKFRIYEVKHSGDTRGDRWDTDIIAFYRRNNG